MSWTAAKLSTDRREAIARAARAVTRLAADTQAKQEAHQQNSIVNDVCAFTDLEAWDAVAVLEGLVLSRGLATSAQIEADRRACRFTAPARRHRSRSWTRCAGSARSAEPNPAGTADRSARAKTRRSASNARPRRAPAPR